MSLHMVARWSALTTAVLLTALGVVMYVMVAGASADPTPSPSPSASSAAAVAVPATLPCCGDFRAGSIAWRLSNWVHSTVGNNWYITDNGNQSYIHITSLNNTGEIRDANNYNECLTWHNGGIYNLTCANLPSQEWTGTQCCSDVWWFTNNYTNQHNLCLQGGLYYEELITATAKVSGLVMKCPGDGNGNISTAQEFAVAP